MGLRDGILNRLDCVVDRIAAYLDMGQQYGRLLAPYALRQVRQLPGKVVRRIFGVGLPSVQAEDRNDTPK